MQSNFISKAFVFFQQDKLKQFKLIRNRRFYFQTTYTLSELRPMIYKFCSPDDIKNHFKYSFYRERINIDYLNSESGYELLRRLNFTDKMNKDSLDLSFFEISDYGLQFISYFDLKHIKKVNLYMTNITDKAFEYLINCNFKQLEVLDLSNTHITDMAIKNLIKCNFKNLKALFVNNTKLTAAVIEFLINCDFKQLKTLWLPTNRISNISKLRTKYPECDILY